MGKFCAMRTCKHADNLTSNIKRYKFPSSVELRTKWNRFVVEGNRNKNFKSQASDNILLCERHFDPTCYTVHGELKDDAIPTIADKFTPEVAFKLNLIPSLESDLLVNVNDFSKTIIKCARTPDSEPGATWSPMEVDKSVAPERILSNGMLELMVIDLGEESDGESTSFGYQLSLPRSAEECKNVDVQTLPEVKQEENDSDEGKTQETESQELENDSKSFQSPRLETYQRRQSRTSTESKVHRAKSPSIPIDRITLNPVKKTTPVNTDSEEVVSRRRRRKSSIQPTAHMTSSSPIPENLTKLEPSTDKFQPASQSAKAKPQSANTTMAVNPDRTPAARLRRKTSIGAKVYLPVIPETRTRGSFRRKNRLPNTESPTTRSRLRSRTSLRPRKREADKVDSPSTIESRLRSRSSIESKYDPNESSSTPLRRGKRASLASSKAASKSSTVTRKSSSVTRKSSSITRKSSSVTRKSSRINKALSPGSKTPFLNNSFSSPNRTYPIPTISPKSQKSLPPSKTPVRKVKYSLPENTLPLLQPIVLLPKINPKLLPIPNGASPPESTSPSSCGCSFTPEEHNNITGIARIPEAAKREFIRRKEDIIKMKIQLMNERQRYEHAKMKMEALTIALKHLKEKRREKSHRGPSLDCCQNCEKKFH